MNNYDNIIINDEHIINIYNKNNTFNRSTTSKTIGFTLHVVNPCAHMSLLNLANHALGLHFKP